MPPPRCQEKRPRALSPHGPAAATKATVATSTDAAHRNDYRLGLILVTGSAIAWSTAGLFTRLIDLDAATMLVWRGLFGAAGLVLIVLVINGRSSFGAIKSLGLPGWAFAIVSALGMIMFIFALRNTSVAHAAVIYATAPLIAAALTWLILGERPSRAAIIASVIALAGVAIMVGLGAEGGLFGDLLALGMTLCVVAMMLIARKYPGIPAIPAATLSSLVSGVLCWSFGAPLAVGAPDLLVLALFGLVNSAAGIALFTLGARLLPAVETALIGALDAPLAPLWVWLVFGETPGRHTLLGGGVVFAAVAIHIVSELRRKPRAPLAVTSD